MRSLKPRPFVQSSFDMQAPRYSHPCFFFFFFGDVAFYEYFFVLFPLSFCIESTSYVLSFRMVFFYLVTTGWIFDFSSCENSINQSSQKLDVPAGVTQEESHTGFFIHLSSAVRALFFVARRIQPFLSLVDRELEFCVLTI